MADIGRQLIPERLRATLGLESEPEVFDVDKCDMLAYARAGGQTCSFYVDEDAARDTRYGGLIATPTFTVTLRFFDTPSAKAVYPIVSERSFDAGMEFFYHEPIRPGDRLTVTAKVIELAEKSGRLGPMILRRVELRFVNQEGKLVLRQTITGLMTAS